MRYYILLISVLFADPALARMYQWVNPDTGTAQLSGRPPAWYRGDEPGPRIVVYENGTLIDDTALAVPPERVRELRQEAFIQDESRRRLAAPTNRSTAPPAQEAEDTAAANASESGEKPTTGEPDDAGLPTSLGLEDIQRLKSIIADWDKLRGSVGGAKTQ